LYKEDEIASADEKVVLAGKQSGFIVDPQWLATQQARFLTYLPTNQDGRPQYTR
jgi:hypothetical protein